ncbi:ankyrin [Cenococcum geophilum 1.58]|uniref:ankyrin n=1 Tax=Cenococcum geophilum 1.58 TaxID=794803 RepID=UPI00358FA2BB|nr:ankyrin [Cenococcum geophilum 1.58]
MCKWKSALHPAGDGRSTQSLQRIEAEVGKMLVESFKLKDFDYLFQRQYVRALQYSLRQYQKHAWFSENAKCALLRCFLTGIGGEPSIDSALEVLMDICTHDDQVVLRQAGMILLSVRLCEAYGKPVPDDVPINHWLWCNAIFGSRHAHDVLLKRDPELAASALKSSRSKIYGVDHEIQGTIQQLLKEPTFLTDALTGKSTDSFVFPETANDDTPLHCAAMAGELETVRALVDMTGADVNAVNALLESPLLQACRAGHFDVVCFLLSHGADPTIQSVSNGETCLHFLPSFHEEWQMRYVTKECLARGADVEVCAAGPQGGMFSYEAVENGSPLHWAVGKANLAAVKTLCDVGADIFKEYPNAKGLMRDSVHLAASRVYVDILKYFFHDRGVLKLSRTCTATFSKVEALLRNLAMSSLSDPVSDRLLHGARYTDSFVEAINLLKESGVPFDRTDAGELLFCVFRSGDVARVEVLLKNGCPIDAPFGAEENVLRQSIVTCDKGMFDLALAYGADVMSQTSSGSHLHLCVRHHHRDTYFAEELLKRGVLVDGPDFGGCTPFRNAVKLGCFELATLFLLYGADKEATKDGMTVLGNLAMAGSDYPLVSLKYLLEPPHEFGAASFIVSPSLQASALQIAAAKPEAGRNSDGNMPYLAYLLERFPLPKHLDVAATGMTALHLAVQACSLESVQLLLEAGADPGILNCRYLTALDMAVEMAENADPSLPDFPEEIYEEGDKGVASYVARRWRMVEVLVSFGALPSEELPTAGLGAAELAKAELQPLLEERGYMSYSESLPTLLEWTKCLGPVVENYLQDIIVDSPLLDRSLGDFARVICEALRPYYLTFRIRRDSKGVGIAFPRMGAEEAEEVEIELVQALSA